MSDRSLVDVRAGLTGAQAQRLVSTPGYSGQIASPDAPLELTPGAICVLRGSGQAYIEWAAGSYAAVVCDSRNRTFAGIMSGHIGRLAVKDGHWEVANTTELIYQVTVAGSRASLEIRDRATGAEKMAPLVVVESGRLLNWRASDVVSSKGTYVLVVFGGLLEQRGALIDGDRLIRGPGGSWIYRPSSAPASDPEIVFASGYSDLSQSEYEISVQRAVIGPLAEIEGQPLHVGGWPPGTMGGVIDLREDYP